MRESEIDGGNEGWRDSESERGRVKDGERESKRERDRHRLKK